MKEENKGFMLAEVIVVSTIVITVLTALYMSFNKLYANYQLRFQYYDVNGLYASSKINNLYTDEYLLCTYLKQLETNDIVDISCKKGSKEYSMCQKIFSTYQVQRMYLVNYDLKDKNFHNPLIDDYISYLGENDNQETSTYHYRIIAVLQDENGANSYANLKMR